MQLTADVVPDLLRTRRRQAQNPGQPRQRVGHVGMPLRRQHQHRNPQPLQLLHQRAITGHQYQIRPQGCHRLHIEAAEAPQMRQLRHRFRPVGKTVHPHQPIAGAQHADRFGQRRRQRHKPHYPGRRCQGLSPIIDDRTRRPPRRIRASSLCCPHPRQPDQRQQPRQPPSPGPGRAHPPSCHSTLPSQSMLKQRFTFLATWHWVIFLTLSTIGNTMFPFATNN